MASPAEHTYLQDFHGFVEISLSPLLVLVVLLLVLLQELLKNRGASLWSRRREVSRCSCCGARPPEKLLLRRGSHAQPQ